MIARYIDVDKIDTEKAYKRNEIYYRDSFRSGVVSTLHLLAKMPTADVVEVKHGEWEEERWCDNFQHICSLCHRTVRVHPQSIAYKYCPYCGAKMDGGSEGD